MGDTAGPGLSLDDLSLHAAAAGGHEARVKDVLDSGLVEVDAGNIYNESALFCAVREGHADVVRLLLARGADPLGGSQDGDHCALHLAVVLGNTEVLEVLLDQDPDLLDWSDEHGNTPLMTAVTSDQRECVELLLEGGARPEICNEDGQDSLDLAILGHNVGMMKLLHGSGMSLRLNDNKPSSIHIATQEDDAEVLTTLLERWANDHIDVPFEGQTSLHVACMFSYSKSVEVLLQHGANVNVPDPGGLSALHLAAEQGDAYIVQRLIDNDADIEAQDNSSVTPLAIAAMQGAVFFCNGSKNLAPDSHLDVVRILLKSGANVNATDSLKQTPLHHATDRRCERVCIELMRHGSDINSRPRVCGLGTPLHIAVQRRSVRLVEAFIRCGAIIDMTDALGERPLHVAVKANPGPDMLSIIHLMMLNGTTFFTEVDRWVALSRCDLNKEATFILLVMHSATYPGHYGSRGDFVNGCLNQIRYHSFTINQTLLTFYSSYTLHRSLRAKFHERGQCERVKAGGSLITSIISTPCSLFSVCVMTVRDGLSETSNGKSIWTMVEKLGLPQSISKCLRLGDYDGKGVKVCAKVLPNCNR